MTTRHRDLDQLAHRLDRAANTVPVTLEMRAAALTAWFKANPPRLRFTRGMALAAERMEREAA